MTDLNSNYISDVVQQNIKLFVKEPYFTIFAHILTEKSKVLPPFKKILIQSFSVEILLKEKEKLRKLLRFVKPQKEKVVETSFWYQMMLLICDVPKKKKSEYEENEFNLNPICYRYLIHLCKLKIKLLTNFSCQFKIPLDVMVKFYLDLCANKINNDKEEKNPIENDQEEKSSNKNIGSPLNKIKKSQKNQKKFIDINSLLKEKKKNMLGTKIEYSNSFTRLFIGEIDPSSVRERYFSNILVKKLKQLRLYSSIQDLSQMYLKRLYNKLFKKDKGIVDQDMEQILNKFKSDSKKVESYQRNALSLEIRKNFREQYVDEEKENLEKLLERQRAVYMDKNEDKNKKKKKKGIKFLSIRPTTAMGKKVDFRYSQKSVFNLRQKNNSRNPYFSTGLSSNSIMCHSAKSQQISFNKNNVIGLKDISLDLSSDFKTNIRNEYPKNESLFSNGLHNKKVEIKITDKILKNISKRMGEKKYFLAKKKRFRFKNYLNKQDFFFSNIN